jgi:hypothetical protein
LGWSPKGKGEGGRELRRSRRDNVFNVPNIVLLQEAGKEQLEGVDRHKAGLVNAGARKLQGGGLELDDLLGDRAPELHQGGQVLAFHVLVGRPAGGGQLDREILSFSATLAPSGIPSASTANVR